MKPVVLTVVGARPQFIKAGPVSCALANAGLREILVHTGQHYDPEMSDLFFEELAIRKPDVNLGIGSGSHASQTARMIAALETAILSCKPDWILVFGDTNSTLAAAIVAAKLQRPIAHVEAGLRSFNRRMPEEVNRLVTDTLSDLLFAPTANSRDNLIREGIAGDRIHVVGDVMLDAALQYRSLLTSTNGCIANLPLSRKQYVVATVHRAENTDEPCRLRYLLDSLNIIATTRQVVFLVHPRTRRLINGWKAASNVHVSGPVGYLPMMQLTVNAGLVVTDSGGLQKEAFFHRVPCVTVREETEWVESVALGWNRLAPPVSVDSIVESVNAAWGSTGIEANPYGDGTASRKIALALAEAVG